MENRKEMRQGIVFQVVSGGGGECGKCQVVSPSWPGLRLPLVHREPRGQQPAHLLPEVFRPHPEAGGRGAQVIDNKSILRREGFL